MQGNAEDLRTLFSEVFKYWRPTPTPNEDCSHYAQRLPHGPFPWSQALSSPRHCWRHSHCRLLGLFSNFLRVEITNAFLRLSLPLCISVEHPSVLVGNTRTPVVWSGHPCAAWHAWLPAGSCYQPSSKEVGLCFFRVNVLVECCIQGRYIPHNFRRSSPKHWTLWH